MQHYLGWMVGALLLGSGCSSQQADGPGPARESWGVEQALLQTPEEGTAPSLALACNPATCANLDGVCCGTFCCKDPNVCSADDLCEAPACDFQADGVCCDSPCTGYCAACTAQKKGYGSDGVCGTIAAGLDPDGECSYSAPGNLSCGATGACDGSGSCEANHSGETCYEGCVGSQRYTLPCASQGCDFNAGSYSECSPYACSGAGVCATSCATDTQCASGAYCIGGECATKRGNGNSCSSTNQCSSGYCVDGVCCNAPCGGSCQSCVAADTGQATGTCGAVKNGTDPGSDCAANAGDPCGFDGECSQGACRNAGQGTTCGAASCSNGTITGSVCNGLGGCVAGSSTSCSPYLGCGGASSCAATCKTDQDCVATHYCRAADKKCVPDLSDGTSCTAASQCASGNCVEGACCNSKCDGTCQSCRAANKLAGADGVCGNVKVGQDPGGDCDDSGPSSCGTDGTCSGAGTCRLYPSGVACGTTKCMDGQVTGSVCNGAGTCNPGSSASCAPYRSCTGNACAASCESHQDCATGSYCRAADDSCVPQLDSGAVCASGAECKTGFCADGVCCNSACDSDCQACSAALKGTGSDGSCGNVRPGSDPHDDCSEQAQDICSFDGECNGQGACRLRAQGYPCGATSCTGNTVKGMLCTGQGNCTNDPNGVLCAPYVCSDASCASPCAGNADCLAGYFCLSGACVTRQDNGGSCMSGAECESSFCVDGVCCDGPCSGQCEACDSADSPGVCAGVDGPPHGNRTPCTGADGECGGSCESDNRTACGYASPSTPCGTTCAEDTETTSLCNGQGACQPSPQTRSCSPYLCGELECKSECESDDECSEGFACSAKGACLPATESAECSEDLQSSEGVNGTTDCAPYLCDVATGACRVACSTVTDCASAQVCEASSKTCVPASDAVSSDDGGCGCRLESASRPAGSWPMAWLLLLLALRRSRRAA